MVEPLLHSAVESKTSGYTKQALYGVRENEGGTELRVSEERSVVRSLQRSVRVLSALHPKNSVGGGGILFGAHHKHTYTQVSVVKLALSAHPSPVCISNSTQQ